jgi:hypothetical protein
MRYWAYMNNQVTGPFDKERLPGVPGFTLASLICPETPAAGEAPGWKAASAWPEVLAVFTQAPVPDRPARAAADSPLAMTMRGTLIDEPALEEPPAKTPAPAPSPAADSPLAMTMRGTLIDGPAASAPDSAAPPAQTMEEMQARLARLESAVAELKALLAPPAPGKD